MKKNIKNIIIGVSVFLGIIVLLLILDIVSVFTRSKPLFILNKETTSINEVYKGIFFNVYNCSEYTVSQIKSKFTKYSCSIGEEEKLSFEIIDSTEVCAEALEEIYKDNKYTYYLPCMKSGNILIKFSNGNEYSLKEVLDKDLLTIDELIENGLNVYKY